MSKYYLFTIFEHYSFHMSNSKRVKLHSEIKNKESAIVYDSSLMNSTYIALALSLIAFLLYSSTITHGFVLDDGLVTTINSYVKQGFSGLWKIFTHSYRAGASITTDSDYMYRPLSVMMYAIEWAIAPNHAWFHHLFNILYYSLTIFILFKTLIKLLGKDSQNFAIAICLIFAVHPIHTEVISNIKSRDEIMSFLFGILSLYYCLQAYENKPKALYIACISFFLALLSKEGAVTILIIIPLCIYFFKDYIPFRFFFPYLIVFILWFLLRMTVMGKVHYIPDVNDNQLVAASILDRWATAFVILLKYLQLLIWPYPLSWDYSFQQFAIVSWSNIKAISSLVVHLLLFVFALKNWKNKNILSFCILAYIISMALYSNLFLLIGTLMGERLTYQASLWFCMGIVLLIARLLKFEDNGSPIFQRGSNRSFYSIISLIFIVFFYLSFQRSKAWKSSYDLFLCDVSQVPNSFRSNQAIADESLQMYMKKYQNPLDSIKYLTQAQKFYEASGSIRKTFSNQVGLGNTSFFQKNYPKAIDAFNSAKSINSNEIIKERLATAYYQYGREEAQINNNLPKAKELLLKAYEIDSSRMEIITDLGMVIGLSQHIPEAIIYFEKAYKMNPKDENTINNLAHSYIAIGQQAKAEAILATIKK
ncbi:MAG: hypothetical protein ABIO44_06650 [Saprospiraceae bacterium]